MGAPNNIVQHEKGGIAALGGVAIGTDTWIFQFAGVPVNGTSGTGAGTTGKGSLCTDSTNGTLYINTGTKSSTVWTVTGTQS